MTLVNNLLAASGNRAPPRDTQTQPLTRTHACLGLVSIRKNSIRLPFGVWKIGMKLVEGAFLENIAKVTTNG